MADEPLLSPLRIAVTGLRGIPDVQGGVERHAEELYPRLARLGCEVTVLARRPFVTDMLSAGGNSDPDSYLYDSVQVVALNASRISGLEAFVHTLRAVLWAAVRRRRIDILHIHAIGPSIMVPLARLLGLRVVTTNHGADYDRGKWGPFAKWLLRTGERSGAKNSNKIIAVSRVIAGALKSKYGVDATYIPNGVTTTAQGDDSDILRRLEVEAGRYFLAVGRLVPEKGLHDLIDAFAAMAVEEDSGSDGWKLVVVGGADHISSYSAALESRAAEIPGVVMSGRLGAEAVTALYRNAGLFILPSYHEGLPIVLLEALAAGCAVIVSDIPANKEVVGGGYAGIFAPGDRAMLSGLMKVAEKEPDPSRTRFSVPADRLEEYDWDNIALSTMEVYRQALRVRVRPSRESIDSGSQ